MLDLTVDLPSPFPQRNSSFDSNGSVSPAKTRAREGDVRSYTTSLAWDLRHQNTGNKRDQKTLNDPKGQRRKSCWGCTLVMTQAKTLSNPLPPCGSDAAWRRASRMPSNVPDPPPIWRLSRRRIVPCKVVTPGCRQGTTVSPAAELLD